MNIHRWGLFVSAILAAFCGLLLWGAREQVRQGSGFLWIPSMTCTVTPTVTASPSPTATITATLSPVPTETPIPLSPSSTPEPSATFTPLPTLDKTAFAAAVLADLTRTAISVSLSQTPAPTMIIADAELTTGLHTMNPSDGKELIYIQDSNARRFGFWIDLSAVSSREYEACIAAGACTQGTMDSWEDNSENGMPDYAAVNISLAQAAAYCEWAGMKLLTAENWYTALEAFPDDEGDSALHLTGRVWEWTADSDGLILGGSWKSGSWDLAHHRYAARMDPDSCAEDVGFRCALDVPRP